MITAQDEARVSPKVQHMASNSERFLKRGRLEKIEIEEVEELSTWGGR